MHRVHIHLSVIALLLASASLAFAQATTKSYSGTYNGAACTVQMTWRNWAGLGAVDGRIKLARGATIPFSGSNTQTGVLDLTANGTAIRLVRRGGGRNTSWSSPTLSLIESAPTPTPSPSPSPTPTPPPMSGTGESSLVDQTYTGTWNGKAFTAQMRWAPGDTPEVLRRGVGKATLEDGTQVSIEGWQPSADSMEFSLAPDPGGATYKTTKSTGEGKAGWESSSLTFIEKK
ncbi:MAG: hypothetical protein ACR2ID_04400 [Chthoniobacterales bacterium]